MQNFQDIIFIRTQTYRKILSSALVCTFKAIGRIKHNLTNNNSLSSNINTEAATSGVS